MAAILKHTWRHIPNELLIMIAECLRPSFGSSKKETLDDADKRGALASLCRLSRDCHAIATPVLYECLDTHSLCLDYTCRLLEQCLLKPHLASHVRRLHVGSKLQRHQVIRLSRHGIFQTLSEALERFGINGRILWDLEEELNGYSNDVVVQLSSGFARGLASVLFLAACQRVQTLRFTARYTEMSGAESTIFSHLLKAYRYKTVAWMNAREVGHPLAELTSVHLAYRSFEARRRETGMMTDIILNMPGLQDCTLEGLVAPPLDKTYHEGIHLRRLSIIDPMHMLDAWVLADILECRPMLEELKLHMFDSGNNMTNMELGSALRRFATNLRKLELRYDNYVLDGRFGHLGSLVSLGNLQNLTISTKLWPGDGRSRRAYDDEPPSGRLPQSLQNLTLIVPRNTDEYLGRRVYTQLIDNLGTIDPLPNLRSFLLHDTERQWIPKTTRYDAQSLVDCVGLGVAAAYGEVQKYRHGYVTEIIFDMAVAEQKRLAVVDKSVTGSAEEDLMLRELGPVLVQEEFKSNRRGIRGLLSKVNSLRRRRA